MGSSSKTGYDPKKWTLRKEVVSYGVFVGSYEDISISLADLMISREGAYIEDWNYDRGGFVLYWYEPKVKKTTLQSLKAVRIRLKQELKELNDKIKTLG